MTTRGLSADAVRLVRRYYVYAGVYTLAASVIWGINTLFLLGAGLTVGEVFIANSAFSIGTVLFEIPTGVTADTIGRRASFLLSLIVLASSTLLYVGLDQVGGGVLAFSLASVLMGLGFTFYSGAMEAWLVDGLQALGYEGEMDRIFSRAQIVGGGAMLVGTVGGGLLGQIDLAIPFLVRSGLLVLLLAMAFRGMHDLGFTPRRIPARRIPAEAARLGAAGVRFGWSEPSLRLLMVAGAVQNGFFFWAWYAWQPYFLELLERDAVWVAGVVAALLAISMMVGNSIVEIVTRWCGKRTTLLIWSGSVFALAMTGVGMVDAFVPAVAFLFLAGMAMGVQTPVRQAFFHRVVPTSHRATVVSFDSMVSGGGAFAGQASLGAYSEQAGFSAGYILGGSLTLLSVPIIYLVRRTGNRADVFVGAQVRPMTACAVQGLPSISAVEDTIPAGVGAAPDDG